ncbi:MAG: prepilin-type N-terminal cleavage/methylation domain-containing protein [Candidatus Levybacteria bacterium]|nr:prepilin-type N-terminal cleavage/methylation domain-containing protein [Candidatus Levybacteria bacterium]
MKYQMSNFKYQISNVVQRIGNCLAERDPASREKLEIGNWKFNRGFTLIELIIVVTIIGILSSLLLANLVGIRGRVRDGQRKSDLTQIKQALEIYRSDNGAYPLDSSELNLSQCREKFESGGNVYMQKIPCDPLDSYPFTYRYAASSDGTTYTLSACLENINDAKKTDPTNLDPCDGTNNWSYTLTNP